MRTRNSAKPLSMSLVLLLACFASPLFGQEAKSVSFDAADGFKLHADFYAPTPAERREAGGAGHKPAKSGTPEASKGKKAGNDPSPPARSGGAATGAPFVILIHTLDSDRKCWSDL